MALIKRADANELARDAVVLDLGDLARQGRDIIQRAQEQADAIVSRANEERERLIEGAAEQGRRMGYDEGFAKGLEEGRQRGAAEALEQHAEALQAVQNAWTAALDDLHAQRDALLAEARADVLRFAARMGERVAKRLAELDPALAADQLEAALRLVLTPSRVRVRVAPSGEAAIARALPALRERLEASAHVQVVADPDLDDGSVVVQADGTTIDATIGTQVARIVRALLPEPAAGARPGDTPGEAP